MVEETTQDDRRFSAPQSVARVIGVLETLCAHPHQVSLAELSRALATPKSSLAAILRGMEEAGLIAGDAGVWRLSPGAFGLGSALVCARQRLQSSDLIREGMRHLALRCGETVLFAVADGDGKTLTYVDIAESRNPLRFAVSAGDRRPLYCTAAGRALLSAANDDELQRYLANLRPTKLTPSTQTNKRELARVIADVRRLGVAQTLNEASDGVIGTAALIRDSSGVSLGALTVAAPSARMGERFEELATLVREEAEAISRSLGYRSEAVGPPVRRGA